MKEPGPWRAEDGLKLLGSPGLGAWLTAVPQAPSFHPFSMGLGLREGSTQTS